MGWVYTCGTQVDSLVITTLIKSSYGTQCYIYPRFCMPLSESILNPETGRDSSYIWNIYWLFKIRFTKDIYGVPNKLRFDHLGHAKSCHLPHLDVELIRIQILSTVTKRYAGLCNKNQFNLYFLSELEIHLTHCVWICLFKPMTSKAAWTLTEDEN